MVMSWVMYRHSPIEFNGVPLHYSLGSQISKLWFFILPGVVAIFWSAITGEQRSQLKKIYLWVYAALLVLGTVQIFTGFPRGQPNPNWPGIYHPILLLGHHLSVASIFIFPFFIFIDQWLDEWLMGDQISGKTTGKRTFSKQLSILLLILQLVQFFFLFSRTLWVALPIGLLIWFIVRFKEIQSSQLCKKWGVIAALIFIPSLGLVGFGYQHLHERLTTQAGVSERQFLWNFNFNLFKQRPLFGIGFGGNEDAAHFYVREVLHQKPGSDIFVGHAHQLFLQLLAGTGIFGFTVFLLMVISLLRLAYFTTPVLIAPWCVLILNGMTQVNWFEGKVFHQISLMTGMMLGNVLISMTQTTQRRIQ
jgi:O-antigen ligase